MTQKYFKIRNACGLYSTGGTDPSFNKLGKVWTLSQLKSHLRLLQKYKKEFNIYENCELTVFTELIEPATITLKDLLDPLKQELVVSKLKGQHDYT